MLSEMGQDALIDIVFHTLGIISKNIGDHHLEGLTIKADQTLVTVIDHMVEAELARELERHFPGIRIEGEEGTKRGSGEIGLLIDPLDGTRAFSCGLSTSTIIIGAYDFKRKQVVGCVVGEASTHRTWAAFENSSTRSRIYTPDDFAYIPRSVWTKSMDEQSTVFLDVPHGFTRKGRDILTTEQMNQLFASLNSKVKISIPGSNGLIQALVANGGQNVVGSITTAIGGPWDVCGAKLVLNAGGSAKAFTLKRTGATLEFLERDPLDVFSYDLLVTGNSPDTVEKLCDHIFAL